MTFAYKIKEGQKVKVQNRQDLGIGEVLRISDYFGVYQADIVFDDGHSRRLESFPIERLELAPDLWQRLAAGKCDIPIDFLLKQAAYLLPLQNTGGQLSNSRTHLLPHQILLTRDVVAAKNRRFLIADEVGLGKTIETGMILRELQSRGLADRILIITPAGLTKNWQNELRDSFRLYFKILGLDFVEHGIATWEQENKVIASIDTLKRPQRMEKLLSAPPWDVIIFDEAHHISRIRYGSKVQSTQNYKLAEALRNHTRDLLFLSATPHQGDSFQFWSLVQLLNDSIFDSDKAMLEHRGLMNQVMIRRTKREVTDANGNPIFMRRQVHTQAFQLSAREQIFYENLTTYLQEGYSAAGLGQAKTTSEQRAIGFVMTTFQKIMSSSLRAIRQALRRRLLVLLIRLQMEYENRRQKSAQSEKWAEKIVQIQDEMRQMAAEIIGGEFTNNRKADLDAFIAQTRQKVSKKYGALDDATEWSLDSDEEGEDGVYLVAGIPDEIAKVRRLVQIIPNSRDRKFDTLLRAIEDIRADAPAEKMVIFTQYRETLEFLKTELVNTFGNDKVATIKGGPLEDKLDAMDKFWSDQGAQFIISTSAGAEGINLHTAHILFNYDLPWNPMAVEQRIGRIHRYGQHDTVHVYNLVAEDTVEQQIYQLLEKKLCEIAIQIGKTDALTGEPLEDFRSEILGFLGASPNYQDLYKKALVDRDYQRTEREIAEALAKAREASSALMELTQDLHAFSLADYLDLEGKFSLSDLKMVAEKAILRLEGSFLPNGDFEKIETPKVLHRSANVLPRYENATFDREAAMRKRSVEFMGLGHPFVDSLLSLLKQPGYPGEVAVLPKSANEIESYFIVTALVTLQLEDAGVQQEFKTIRVNPTGQVQVLPEDWLINRIRQVSANNDRALFSPVIDIDLDAIQSAYEGAMGAILTQSKIAMKKPIMNARVSLLGIAFVN